MVGAKAIAIALAAMATVSTASSSITIPPSCIYPFEGELIPLVLPVSFILEECNFIGKEFNYQPLVNPLGQLVIGCAVGGKSDPDMPDLCFVVLNGTIDDYYHELAHCNGWPAYHPSNFICNKKEN